MVRKSSHVCLPSIKYLEEWREKILLQIGKIKEEASSQKKEIYFSIGTTSGSESRLPYLTPVRILENGILTGVVVFSQTQALIAAKAVMSEVDKVLVDAEKKIAIQIGSSDEILRHFNVPISSRNDLSRANVEFGNISSAVRAILPSKQIIDYKPNDITADAIWELLSLKLKNLSGKRIGLIGCGNIGFKLALKLVESGSTVSLYRRDANRGVFIANAINMIKPATTIAMASYASTPLQASIFSDVLIGAANTNIPVITLQMIQAMSPDGFVLDIGKGNIEEEAIHWALQNDVEVIRGDISAAIYGFISHAQQAMKTLESRFGRRYVGTVSLISGGMFGLEGEVIVDDYVNPTMVYGISDGAGNTKLRLTNEDKKNLMNIKNLISKKEVKHK
jgi:molybdopterin/thiamine biosynthesis adenylyltransferase